MRSKISAIALAVLVAGVSSANAAVIDFTGGTVFFNGGGSAVTNNTTNYGNVASYEEDGFRVEFIFLGAPVPFASNIGTYYGTQNDVIHGHWELGEYGNLTEIRISRIDNAAFDLNYFLLTSNTDTGGAPASGNERAFIKTSNNYSMMLPPENWGFPAVAVNLDSNFDSITSFSFYVENGVDCFGMDEFYLNQEAPNVPEPATMLLVGTGIAGAFARRRRQTR